MEIPWDAMPEDFRRLFMEAEIDRAGSASQAMWACKDGWRVAYTTTRVKGGPQQIRGRFAAMAYKPVGRGARSGKAQEWKRVYLRGFATRKSAKRRAEQLYDQHSR